MIQYPFKYKIRITLFLLGLSLLTVKLIAQGTGTPSTLRVKTDANGYLIASAVAQTAPISQPTVFTNTRIRTDANGYLLVTIGAGGNPFFDSVCFSSSTKDTVIKEVGANDLGIYTGATACAGGTLRFDVSATAVTSTLPVIINSAANGYVLISADVNGSGIFPNGTTSIDFSNGNNSAFRSIRANAGTFASTVQATASDISFIVNGRGSFGASGSGLLTLGNVGSTSGFGIDVTTDATAWFKTRGQADTAILKAGTVTVGAGGLTAYGTGSWVQASTGLIYWNTRAILDSPADGQFRITNQAQTTGGLFDVSTDLVGWWKSRAGADTAILKSSIHDATGYFQNLNDTNGQSINALQTLTELTTIAASPNTDTTIQMPANSVVLGVTVRVTTVIPTCATFTVGDSGSAARFSTAAVSCAATSTDPGTKAAAYYNASALSIRITPNAQPAANTGRVRVTIYYYTVTPSTS